MMSNVTRPYQIPYRIMVPKERRAAGSGRRQLRTSRARASGSSLPGWRWNRRPHRGSPGDCRRPAPAQRSHGAFAAPLLKQDQERTFFTTWTGNIPAHQAMQLLGTKGFFRQYRGRRMNPSRAARRASGSRSRYALPAFASRLRHVTPEWRRSRLPTADNGRCSGRPARRRRRPIPGSHSGALCITLDRMLEKVGH